MSSQMSIHEEIKEQQLKTKDMSFKGKLSYFWYYYKIHTIVAAAVIVFVVSLIHAFVTHKDYGFYTTLINAQSTAENLNTSAVWAEEFLEFAGIDPDEYQVYIDTTVMFSGDGGDSFEASNREKMVAMMQVGDINAIVSDTETFEGYAQVEYFYDLESVFTPEELAPYRDYLYYTDAATFDQDDDVIVDAAAQQAVYELDIDHMDPDSMKDPIAVGICIPAQGNKLADAGYYSYLSENDTTFQGHPSQVVIGIPISNQEPQLALKFLEYLEIGA